MPKFKYTVRDTSGNTETGLITAESPDEATKNLQRDGKTIVSSGVSVLAD